MESTNYTESDFINAVLNSETIKGVLMKLGIAPMGGNYGTVRKWIKKLNLDTSHFNPYARSDKRPRLHHPIAYYLNDQNYIRSNTLKHRLICEGYFEHKCYHCGLTEWLGKTMPIELEHIDGNNQNNHLDNLTILCPNCHTFTPTYKGRNRRKAN